jgi:hypothetical protein
LGKSEDGSFDVMIVVHRTFAHDFSGECLAQVKEAKTNAGIASQAKHY